MKSYFVLLLAILAVANAVEVSVDYDLLEGENVASEQPIPEPLVDELLQGSLSSLNDETEVTEDNYCPPKKYDDDTNPDHLSQEHPGQYDPDELGDGYTLGADDADVLFSSAAARMEDTDEATLDADEDSKVGFFDAELAKGKNAEAERELAEHADSEEHFKDQMPGYISADLHDADRAMKDSDALSDNPDVFNLEEDAKSMNMDSATAAMGELQEDNLEGEINSARDLDADADVLAEDEDEDEEPLDTDDAGDADDDEEDDDEENHFEEWDGPEEEDPDEE